MKTLKSIMLGLAFLVVGTVANASTKQATAALTKNDVLNIYVNAVIHGKIDGVENILAKDVKFTMYRGDKEFNLDKKQLLESLKASENIEQGCTYNTSILDETDNRMTVKLTMRYDGYVRVNLITIALNHADFKITKIETQS
ncbi:hypothetical protein [Mucilaginibacter sp. UR6-11]|uniref:hypothetical protein n=1 Tax=Mucilaginibacter sp. UR6-11 TaxID=1435644 RepID=UPI001E60B722|nr:hypothetical protein [Mucilaginibacter sp. UR6-11]MCC8424254.1 hypothetical protein [Mucilaginibacter sp. UR6-11]